MYRAKNVYFICGFAAIGGGLFGFDISSMSGVLGTQAYKRYFNNPVSYSQGGITASMPLGSFVGSLGSSYLADRYSRKVAMQFSCLLWILGSVIQATSINIPILCTGRAISGLCVGITSSVVPIYQSEIAPREIRGRAVSLQQWAITWGILIQFFIQYACAQTISGGPTDPNQSTLAFRIPWAVQAVPAVILLVGLFWFPHSPRWLASQGRWGEARDVLAELVGKGDTGDARVLATMKEILESLSSEGRVDGDVDGRQEFGSGLPRQDSGITTTTAATTTTTTTTIIKGGDYRPMTMTTKGPKTTWKQLLNPRILRRVFLGMSLQSWSQLTGMNIMMYYIVYIMSSAGVGTPLLTASIQYIVNVALTLPAILYLDRFGRRPALLLGSLGLMTTLFVSGALQQYYGEPNTEETRTPENADITWIVRDQKGVSAAIVACSYLFVATFATTWGPVSWTYPAEIFPGRVRARAVSLATASNWFWNCALAFAVPPLLWNMSYRMYYLFGAFNAAAFLHMFFFAPETKGYTLEEMDEVFDFGCAPWKSGFGLDSCGKGRKRKSRLEELQHDIEAGRVRVEVPNGDGGGGAGGDGEKGRNIREHFEEQVGRIRGD